MNINLTLLAQAAHFVIAYLIITKIVLKPAMAIFNKEKEKEQRLEKSILEAKVKVQEKQDHKNERWQICQRYFKYHQPKNVFESPKIRFDKIEIKQIKEPNQKELANIAEKISKKVINYVIKDKVKPHG